MVAKPANFEEEMRSAFKVFDRDGSGTISKDEMAEVMSKFGETLTSEELNLMLQEVDKNGDGTIDCEFQGEEKAVMQKRRERVLTCCVMTDEEFVSFFVDK